MTKIKRFAQVNEAKGIREDGFYWVLFKNDTEWTVGKYTPINGDGTKNTYPWEVVASDEIFIEDQFQEIGDRVVYKQK